MDDRIAEILMRICKTLGEVVVANLIDFRDDVPEKKLYAELEKFADKLEKKYKSRLFEFHDKTKRSLIRFYIIDFREEITIEGEPSIMINDFPDGLQAEKNPVLRLELVYNTIEERDKDIEELKFLIK